MVITTDLFKRVVYIIIFPFLFFNFQCNKNKTTPCIFGGYSFAVTAEWYPQKKIYNVGDTIYLTSVFPKKLTDLINPSLIVDYSNSVGISGDIGIASPDSLLKTNKPARDSFQFISITGSFVERPGNRNQGINIKFIESGVSYQFNGAIVCKKKDCSGYQWII